MFQVRWMLHPAGNCAVKQEKNVGKFNSQAKSTTQKANLTSFIAPLISEQSSIIYLLCTTFPTYLLTIIRSITHDKKTWKSLACFITIFFTYIFPICFSSTLDLYDSCEQNFVCGNVSLGFPFWGGSLRPKDCGYPDLQLTCNNNVNTKITISGMEYYVLDANPTTEVLRIAREDLYDGLCLQKFVNTTLNYARFSNALGSQNITILYGCQTPSDGGGGDGSATTNPGQFTCRINGVNETTAYYQPGATGPNGCYGSVIVPIVASSEVQIETVGLEQVIDQGFEVNYKVEDYELCAQCAATKGRCGFDLSKNKASCLCLDGSVENASCTSDNSTGFVNPGVVSHKKRIVIAACSAIGICIFILVTYYFKRRFLVGKPGSQDIEAIIRKYGSLAPKRYTYRSLKKATNSFQDKLGEGGYGTVYSGKLLNGQPVAVKLLKKSTDNAEEFINEVTSIGQTNHVNVVRLLGFCCQGKRRGLVYEFMPNGSLEKFLYGRSNNQSLAWEKLFEISVGIARGLEYLHRGCNTRIVHFDIKPHNILLDEDFCPKISDFGLAKSSQHKESIMSMSGARGTIGFIAPEMIYSIYRGVSHKSDVYSYGMLVMDMVGCRNKVKADTERSSEQYFPQWIYKQLEQMEEQDRQEALTNEGNNLQRKMIIVSLWCIQVNPSSRPAMTQIVDMLEGPLESLEVPPVPSLYTPPLSIGFRTRSYATDVDQQQQNMS